MMVNINKIVKNDKLNRVFKYSSIKYIALFIGFAKGIMNANVLGPELFGMLGNLFLILSYLGYSNFGILFSMNREYVIYESEDNVINKKNVIYTTFTAISILSIFMLLIGFSSKYIFKGSFGNYIVLIFIIGILEQYKSFYTNYFRLVDDFKKINHIELLNNMLSFILIIASIKYFKIYSVLISMLIADSIIFIYGFKNSEKIKWKLDKVILNDLLIVGFPLLIYNLGFFFLTTIDRVMIINLLGYEDLGYYTFSNQLVTGTLVFITSVFYLYYPKAIKDLNIKNNKNIEEVLSRTENYTKYVETFGVILCVTGVLFIKPLVNMLVPQYFISINIYRILVFGTIANQIAYFSNVFIVSNKKQIYLIYLQLLTVLLAISLNLILIKLGFGVLGVSLATLITNISYSIMQYKIYLKLLKTKRSHLKILFKVYSKFVLYILLNVILSLTIINSILYTIIIIAITLILYYKNFMKIILDITIMTEG